MLVADLKVLFNYSYDEIMYKIPLNSLLMQYHSYNQKQIESYKNLNEKTESKKTNNNMSVFSGL